MHQLDEIISQLELLKQHLTEGQNTQAQAMLALFKGHRIQMRRVMRKLEKEFILAGLDLENYNQTIASERLGVTEANLRYMMKKHGIQRGQLLKAKERQQRSKSRIFKAE